MAFDLSGTEPLDQQGSGEPAAPAPMPSLDLSSLEPTAKQPPPEAPTSAAKTGVNSFLQGILSQAASAGKGFLEMGHNETEVPAGYAYAKGAYPTENIPAQTDKMQDNPIYQNMDKLQKFAETAFPVTPQEKSEHPIAAGVGSGLGSIAPVMALGAVAPEAAAPLMATGAGGYFGLSGAGEEAAAARQKGATPEQIENAKLSGFGTNFAAGTADLGAVLKPIERSAPGLASWAEAKLQQALRGGITFTGVGEAQDFLLNQFRKDYDPKAQYSPDGTRILSDLITGGILGPAGHANLKDQNTAPPEQPPVRTEPPLTSKATGPYELGFDIQNGLKFGAKDEQGNFLPHRFDSAEQAQRFIADLNAGPSLQKGQPQSNFDVALSANTSSIPGLKDLADKAADGDQQAHETLNAIALNQVHRLTSGIRSVGIESNSNTGLYGGYTEPSLGLHINFDEEHKPQVLAALAKTAQNFNQEAIHVRQPTEDAEGTPYPDGSYATPSYRIKLKEPLSRPEVEKVIADSGLSGITFNPHYLEAYYVGDPSDTKAHQEFKTGIKKAIASVGDNGAGVEQGIDRLWHYGDSPGAIPYSQIASDLHTPAPGEDPTAKLIASQHKGEEIQGEEQAPSITTEQAERQRQIAHDYEALPDNTMDDPRTRRAYEALAREVEDQYKQLPIKVEAWSGEGEPYKNSEDMRRDIQDNNHLYYYPTREDSFGPPGSDFSGHPLLEKTPFKDMNGHPMLANDLLRVVHDYYAHDLSPTNFGPRGEEAAWKNHMKATKSPWAKWALTSEARGQNSWVNFNNDVYGKDVPLKERPFARQKAALLPIEHALTGDEKADAGMREMAHADMKKEEQTPNSDLRFGVFWNPDTFDKAPKNLTEHVIKVVNNEARRMFPNTKVETYGKMTLSDNTIVHGVHFIDPETAKHIIAWSLEAFDPRSVIQHEGIHYIRRSGLLTSDEWSVLEKAADKGGWLQKHNIPSRYSELPERVSENRNSQIEEAIAEEFGAWRHGEKVPAPVQSIFAKLKLFLDRVAQGVRKVMGKTSADDIFQKIHSGEVGNREPQYSNNAIAYQKAAEKTPAPAKDQDDFRSKLRNAATTYEKASVLMQGVGKKLPEQARDLMGDIAHGLRMWATPMAEGTHRAAAVAKDFANRMRLSQWQRNEFDKFLTKNFKPDDLKNMWDAMDKTSVHVQTLMAQGKKEATAIKDAKDNKVGIFSLPEDQQAVVRAMSDYAGKLWQEAKAAGMVKGEGLPFWTPRMAASIGEDGMWKTPKGGKEGAPSLDTIGRNLSTTAGSMKKRKYLTAAETEEAMKEHFGDATSLIRNIRTMPLAMERFERAIGGRQLINEVKAIGKMAGTEVVSDSDKPGFFTLDHPAFKTWRPKLEKGDDGKWTHLQDENGKELFEKVPIYVAKEFEGPLRAVLSSKPNAVYNALMALKGKATGLIMYSPLIHNAVEYGRALPLMPGKMLTFAAYRDGAKAKKDAGTMREFIDAGLVPIGSRFFNQDITSMMEEPNLTPGRSFTAKLAGKFGDILGKEKGEAVRRGIDKAGDFWHNTLLWDRIGDLQMGLAVNVRDNLLEKGYSRKSANTIAAHFANRYAGALPMENMGEMARRFANVAMFSRSFTVGNWGVMKDMMSGLPKDVRAQIERDAGTAEANKASKYGQRKAMATFALDIALLYALNNVTQAAMDKLLRDKDLGVIGKGYADRFHSMMQKTKENPGNLLNPFFIPDQLSNTSQNEPGKEDRILFDQDRNTGTAFYMRLPTGKIGEEFKNYMTSPLDMLRKKESTIIKPAMDVLNNQDYFGNPVYDKDAKGAAGMVKNIGKVVGHIMAAQVPMDSVQSAYRLMTGHSGPNTKLDVYKAAGPLAGLTFSKGYPGGPEAGVQAATKRRHDQEIKQALPEIKQAVENEDYDSATKIMTDMGMTASEQRSMIKRYAAPQSRLNPTSLGKFNRTASPDEIERMENVNQ